MNPRTEHRAESSVAGYDALRVFAFVLAGALAIPFAWNTLFWFLAGFAFGELPFAAGSLLLHVLPPGAYILARSRSVPGGFARAVTAGILLGAVGTDLFFLAMTVWG